MSVQITEPTNPSTIKENWDEGGRMELPDDVFDAPGGDQPPAVDPDQIQPDNPQPAQDPNVNNQQPNVTPNVNPANPNQPQDPRFATPQQDPNQPPQTPEQPKEPETPAEPKLLAGKYQNEQDLKNAFIQLGGDPEQYENTADLEHAYSVRQSEYTRTRQQMAAEKAKQTQIQQIQDSQKTPQQLTQEVLSQIDTSKFDQAQNAGELGKMLVESLAPALMQAFEQNKPLTPDQMVEQISPIMQQRERAITELNTLEGEVPRLKLQYDDNGQPQPNPFRDAFGVFVSGLKQSGQYVGLNQAFKDFVGNNQAAVDDAVKQRQKEQELKATQQATNPSGNANNQIQQPVSQDDDILSGIISAHDSQVAKFGGGF